MADFDVAVRSVLGVEGSLVVRDEHLRDRSNSPRDAASLFRKHFWDAHKIGQFQDQRIATLFFHLVVNNPGKVTVMSFQLAMQDAGVAVPATGFVGPKTIAALNGLVDEKKQQIVNRFKLRMLDRYRRLAVSSSAGAADLIAWETRLSNL